MPNANSVSVYAKDISIVQGSYGPGDVLSVPIAEATIIAEGDLVNSSATGQAECLDAAGDNDTFIGVSQSLSRDGDTGDISVLIRCLIKGKLAASANTYLGYGLKYNAGPGSSGSHTGTTAWSFVAATAGADLIAWAAENLTSGTGPFKILINSLAQSAAIGAGGGFWEAAAA